MFCVRFQEAQRFRLLPPVVPPSLLLGLPVSNVRFGTGFGRPLMRLMLSKVAQHHFSLSVQGFRHQVSGIGRATDLLDPELLLFLFLLQP